MNQSDYEEGVLENTAEPELECTKCGETVDGCDMCGKAELSEQDQIFCGECHEVESNFSHVCKTCYEKIGKEDGN